MTYAILGSGAIGTALARRFMLVLVAKRGP